MPIAESPYGGTYMRPGPRIGPRRPADPEHDLAFWGVVVRTAYAVADANRSPGTRSALKVQEPYRSTLIAAIRAAYADGWSYADLERETGHSQRVLRRWAVEGGWLAN